MVDRNSRRSSKISDVAVELDGYKIFHGPSTLAKTESNPNFIGRKGIQEDLELILTDNDHDSGAYLITGYRGMGKTSVVREVLKKLDEDSYSVIELSLSQQELREDDLLRQIARLIHPI